MALIHRFDEHAFYFPSKLLNVMSRSESEGPLSYIKVLMKAPPSVLQPPSCNPPSIHRALMRELSRVLLKSRNSSFYLLETQSERGNVVGLA